MKILVKDITSQGLDIQKSLAPAAIGLEDKDIKSVTPLEVAVRVERVGNSAVLAKARISAKFSFTCSRCLEEVERETKQDFLFNFDVDKTTEFIDVGEEIRQEIILSAPIVVLCRDDCQGICAGCGVNLNLEKCKCTLKKE